MTKNRIKEVRLSKNLTLEQLGKKISLGKNTLSRYENGIHEPKLATWQKLASALNTSVPYLQGITDTQISSKDRNAVYELMNNLVANTSSSDKLKSAVPKSASSIATIQNITVALYLLEQRNQIDLQGMFTDYVNELLASVAPPDENNSTPEELAAARMESIQHLNELYDFLNRQTGSAPES